MDTFEKRRVEALKSAEGIATEAKSAGRDLTADEQVEIRKHLDQVKAIDAEAKSARESRELMTELAGHGPVEKSAQEDGDPAPHAKSLGEHFVKTAYDSLMKVKGTHGFSVSSPEFDGAKANTDVIMTGTTGSGGVILPDQDHNWVKPLRRRLTVADWLGSGTITSNAITYFTEGIAEGNFATVAEGAGKPQLSFGPYSPVTETLRKVAGFIKVADEMMEDAPFLLSEIDNRLLYMLGLFEENQLLAGDGAGTNVRGILNRSGLQTLTVDAGDSNIDALFEASTLIDTATGLVSDGVMINPADYQKFRLSKDANGQYFAGGPFTGQYGVGGVMQNPPLWGKETIVTPAIPAGTVLVGSGQAGTVYRKGGVRVEASNSADTDFTHNRTTLRAEERLALAVRVPSAFVKVTLGADTP